MKFSQYINFFYFSAIQPLIFLKQYVFFVYLILFLVVVVFVLFCFFGGPRWVQSNFAHMIGRYAKSNLNRGRLPHVLL